MSLFVTVNLSWSFHMSNLSEETRNIPTLCPYKIPTYLPNVRVQSRIWKTFNGKNIVFRLPAATCLPQHIRASCLRNWVLPLSPYFSWMKFHSVKKPTTFIFWASVVSSSNFHSSVAIALRKKVWRHSPCLSFSPNRSEGGRRLPADSRPKISARLSREGGH